MNNKSVRSFEAGNKLIACKLYTQSIHCFYYSVLQMMMHRLSVCSDRPLDLNQQKEKARIFNTSTHDWLFSEIRNKLNRSGRVIFSETFRNLKTCRIEADYGERSFDQEESVECKENAEKLIAKLRDIK